MAVGVAGFPFRASQGGSQRVDFDALEAPRAGDRLHLPITEYIERA